MFLEEKKEKIESLTQRTEKPFERLLLFLAA